MLSQKLQSRFVQILFSNTLSDPAKAICILKVVVVIQLKFIFEKSHI